MRLRWHQINRIYWYYSGGLGKITSCSVNTSQKKEMMPFERTLVHSASGKKSSGAKSQSKAHVDNERGGCTDLRVQTGNGELFRRVRRRLHAVL